MNLISKNFIANFLSNFWLAFIILIGTPIYVNILGIEKYSLIGFYFTWLVIIGIIDTGISHTISRQIAFFISLKNEKYKIPSLFYSFEIIYWLLMLCLGVILI